MEHHELIFTFEMLGVFPLPDGKYVINSSNQHISQILLQVEHSPLPEITGNGSKRLPPAQNSSLALVFKAQEEQSVDTWGNVLGDPDWSLGALPPQVIYNVMNDTIDKVRTRGYPYVAMPDFSLQSVKSYQVSILEGTQPVRLLTRCETYPDVSLRPSDPSFIINDNELANTIATGKPLEFYVQLYLDGWRYLCIQDFRSAQIAFANAVEAISIDALFYALTVKGIEFDENEILSFKKYNHHEKRFRIANTILTKLGFHSDIDIEEKCKIVFRDRNAAMHGQNIQLSMNSIGAVKEAVGDLINWLQEFKAYRG